MHLKLSILQEHVPGFRDGFQELKNKGVDEVFCVSVNDPFVMAAWGKQLGTDGKVSDFIVALLKCIGINGCF